MASAAVGVALGSGGVAVGARALASGVSVASSEPADQLLPPQHLGAAPASAPPTVQIQSATVDGLTLTVMVVAEPVAAGTTITGLVWNWGDGAASDSPTHTYAQPGTYTVTDGSWDSVPTLVDAANGLLRAYLPVPSSFVVARARPR